MFAFKPQIASIFLFVFLSTLSSSNVYAEELYPYTSEGTEADSAIPDQNQIKIDRLEDQISSLKDLNRKIRTEAKTDKKRALRDQEQRLRQEFARELQAMERAKTEPLTRTLNVLNQALKKEIDSGKMAIALEERGLVITLYQKMLYDAGQAKLKKEAFPALNQIAIAFLREVPKAKMFIEGHTDNDPIRKSRWKSNWELSSARALGVLHYLGTKGKIPGNQLAATAYGEFRPRYSNKNRDEKVKNRRIEILILPAN